MEQCGVSYRFGETESSSGSPQQGWVGVDWGRQGLSVPHEGGVKTQQSGPKHECDQPEDVLITVGGDWRNKTSFQDPTAWPGSLPKFPGFITGTGNVPRRDGTLRVLRHTVACFRGVCPGSWDRTVHKVTGQDTGQVGSLKNGSRWDHGSRAWAPHALGHYSAV